MDHSVAQLSSKSDICIRGSLIAKNNFGLVGYYSSIRGVVPREPAKVQGLCTALISLE